MSEPALNGLDALPGVALVPSPIERFSRQPELNDEVAGQVLRFDFAPFLSPEAEQGGFVVAHDDPGIGAADEAPTTKTFGKNLGGLERESHDALQFSCSRKSSAALRMTPTASTDKS